MMTVGPAPAEIDDTLWVELLTPALDTPVRSPLGLVEVSGRAGSGAYRAVDIVIAIDLSESTFYPSGADVDLDGTTGEIVGRGARSVSGAYRPIDRWTTDPDDTIVRAELEAARRLVRRLALGDWARVGIVTFTGQAKVLAPVGEPAAALEALNDIRASLDLTGTNIGAAVHRSLAALRNAPARGERQQIVLVLSDGQPTMPTPGIHARSYALNSAKRAARHGVPVYGFALGDQSDARSHVLQDMAEATGGKFVAVEHVADVVDHLPYTDFAGIEAVDIHNVTTGSDGRAVRIFADGSFDGFVQLAAGPNLVEITVRTSSGREIRVRRPIDFQPLAPASTGDLDALHDTIRRRTLEMELAKRVRRAPQRNLEIEVLRQP